MKKDFPQLMQMDYGLSLEYINNVWKDKLKKCLVFEEEQYIKGYIIYRIFSEHIDIYEIYVDAHYRRDGIGTSLIAKLLGNLQREQREIIKISVRDNNLGLHLFLKNLGFIASINEKDPAMYDFTYKIKAVCPT